MLDKLENIADNFAERRMVKVINAAFLRLVPFFTIGAIALAFLNLPIPGFQDFLAVGFDGRLGDFAQLITDCTFSVIAIAALCSLSLSYALEYVDTWNGRLYLFIPMFTSFCCFVILFVWQDSGLNFINIGTNGIFKALLVSLTSTKILFTLFRITSRRFYRYRGYDANIMVHSAFSAIIPVAITLVIFVLVRLLSDLVLAATDLNSLLLSYAQDFMQRGDLLTVIVMILISQLLAFIGAHNFMLFDLLPVVTDLLPNTSAIFTAQGYYLHFGLVGGSGASFGLLIALFIAGRKWQRARQMARVSAFPMLFNINEPLLYGFPIIFSPVYFIPFIVTPLISAIISYFAFSLGWVPPIIYAVGWTTPPLLSGYIATGSYSASILQACCILISAALYYPFVRMHHNFVLKQRQSRFHSMQKAAEDAAHGRGGPIISRDDVVGEFAREFAAYLRQRAAKNKLPFFMVYQPKTNREGRVVGSEALLRWHDPEMGYISPVTAVELMSECGLASELGRWVCSTAIREFAELRQSHLSNLRMSININPRHLEEDPGFVTFLAGLRDHYVIIPGEIELEITELVAITASEQMRKTFQAIRDIGIGLTIDDLG
ncbi:MAG: EAL domain-containing protein, partial [Coriobacteriales bacterium]|nr:EAL domain-containing protein [Coriobacteriales bacterium]